MKPLIYKSPEGEIFGPLPKDLYGYELALTAAGAIVHNFEQFGSYQGRWVAYVTYQNKTGWVTDYYGSCSGCDNFEADVGYKTDEPDYPKRVIDFGKKYLEEILTQDEMEKIAREHSTYDLEDQRMLNYVCNFPKAFQ
jgi:hypothetical protein